VLARKSDSVAAPMTGVGSKPSLGSFAHIPERGEGGHGMVRVRRELFPYLLLMAAFIRVET